MNPRGDSLFTKPCPIAGDAVQRLGPALRRGADRGWVLQQLRHARGRQRLGLGYESRRAARRRDEHQLGEVADREGFCHLGG